MKQESNRLQRQKRYQKTSGSLSMKNRCFGFDYHITLKRILQYQKLLLEKRLTWLYQGNLLRRLYPKEVIELQEKIPCRKIKCIVKIQQSTIFLEPLLKFYSLESICNINMQPLKLIPLKKKKAKFDEREYRKFLEALNFVIT